MFVLQANKNQLIIQEKEPVTSGSVNVCPVRFEFSPDWDGLTKTAVFQAGGRSWSVLLEGGGGCAVPWEALERPGCHLFAGVYGQRGADTVLPTVWADLGTVLEGAAPGEEAQPPTPELWQQELAQKGDRLAYTDTGELGLYAGENVLSSVPGQPGSTGLPIGTVISYMGTMAPAGYLVCDGGVYPISSYEKLSSFFQAQFGAANQFGGDGETTFAVPDLRNLFLRGYHGEAEELSGDVGKKQEGTVHTAIHSIQAENWNYAFWSASRGRMSGDLSLHTENADTEGPQEESMCGGAALVGQGRETSAATYTARPVNAAVLYCIKAV